MSCAGGRQGGGSSPLPLVGGAGPAGLRMPTRVQKIGGPSARNWRRCRTRRAAVRLAAGEAEIPGRNRRGRTPPRGAPPSVRGSVRWRLVRSSFPSAGCRVLWCGPPPAQRTGAARWPAGGCAGGERCRPGSGPVPGEVWTAGPGEGRREGGHGMPGRGGTRGGAGGGGAGGSLKEAEISVSNSASSHCGSSQIRSANAAPASRVDRVMPITLPGICGSITRSMTDTLFI